MYEFVPINRRNTQKQDEIRFFQVICPIKYHEKIPQIN